MNPQIGFDPDRPARLYVDGVFDMTHFGHFRLFESCKKRFPYVHLIVGVNGDTDCTHYKNKCVLTEQERAENIRHCRWVDEVICPGPWFLTDEYLTEQKIDFVCHDDVPYAYEGGDLYTHIKKQGKFLATYRTEGISTSLILSRVYSLAGTYTTKAVTELEINEDSKKQLIQKGEELADLWQEHSST